MAKSAIQPPSSDGMMGRIGDVYKKMPIIYRSKEKMVIDFTFLGYSLLAGHVILGVGLVAGGYFIIKRVFNGSKNAPQASDKKILIDVEPKKDEPTISQAA